MRLKFHFVPQALKNLKVVLMLIHKLIQTQTPLPKVYVIYFIHMRSIRILVDSRRSPIIISMSQQMLVNENLCVLKQDKDMVSFTFDNTLRFFQEILAIIEKEDLNGVIFDLKRQKLENQQKRFLKMMLKNNNDDYSKLPVDPPRYDQHPIKYHPWISGCIEHKKLVELIMPTEQLSTMLRFLSKMKQYAATKLRLTFNFEDRTYDCRSSDSECLQFTQSEFKCMIKPEGLQEIQYQISMSSLKIVHQMIKKFKQLKIVFDTNYAFVIIYMKEDLFVTHVKMDEWIKAIGAKVSGEAITKIQYQQENDWA